MATALNNAVYDTTKITPPPAPTFYSLSANDSGTDNVMVLDTAGTWDGDQVVGVLFDNASTYYSISSVSISDGLLGSTDTDIRCKLPGGSTIYLLTTTNYAVPVVITNGTGTANHSLSGKDIAVGPNRRRKYLLGYI